MKDLFVMDAKDYPEDGPVFRRPSARAVISHDGKMLLIYSKKFNCFQLPGGGIRDGEDPRDALCREVEEETGYRVIPESIEEFGRVLRRNADEYNEGGIFEQENLHYFCDIEEEQGELKLDRHEIEEECSPTFTEPYLAVATNRYADHGELSRTDAIVIEREMRVIEMADLAIRQRDRIRRDKAVIDGLGKPEHGDVTYAAMLDFVEDQLEHGGEGTVHKRELNYSRFRHTKRVLAWALRLYELASDKSVLSFEDVVMGAIFHDVGRKHGGGSDHAAAGVPITRDFLTRHGFEKEQIDHVCMLVGEHSNKRKMWENGTDPNLILIMEADLMDETGALSAVMDCMIIKGRYPDAIFEDCFDHISRFTQRQMKDNPMCTEAAKKIWEEKRRLTDEFCDALRYDLEMDRSV